MIYPTQRKLLIGKRVRLLSTSDPYTDLKPGDEGVVVLIDDMGTVFVDWDNGSKLGMVPNVDRYQILDSLQEEASQ